MYNVYSITWRSQDLPILISHLAAQGDLTHPAADLPAFEGRPATAGVGLGGADLPGGVRIDLHDGLGLVRQAEDLPRVGMQPGNQVFQGQTSFMDRGEQQRQGGLQARETRRRLRPVLLGQGVRRMIGGKTVDHRHVLP